MPRVATDGVECYYETLGTGEPVVLVSDLGFGPWCWGWQAPVLAEGFEVIVPSLRATGPSTGDAGDDYRIGTLADDLKAVLADHGVASAAVVGAGLGGMVALDYAHRHTRADRLALLGTTAEGRDFDTDAFGGAPDELSGLLSGTFREERPAAVERIADWRREEDATAAVIEKLADAVDAFDATGWLHEVTCPTLVLHGEADEVVPMEAGESLAAGLPRGKFERFRAGSHLFFLEQARLVTDRLVGFLESEA